MSSPRGEKEDRTDLWLPLLRELTESLPGWGVWKNVESALVGTGDIDTVSPARDWPVVRDTFHAWVLRNDLGPTIVCPHAPFLMHLVAASPGRATFLELDVNARKVFLGSTLFLPEDLLPMMEIDARGFRKIRAGAEGLIKLVGNGMYRNGRPNPEGLKVKKIPELLRQDPEGVQMAARLFGPAARSISAGAAAVSAGRWNRAAMLETEAWCLARAVREPKSVAARIRFRYARKSCPVLRSVFAGRRIPGDPKEWLRQVGQDHVVLGMAS